MFFLRPIDIFIEILPIGPDIDVEHGRLDSRCMFFSDDRFLRGIHTAHRRTILMVHRSVTGADTMHPCNLRWRLLVTGP